MDKAERQQFATALAGALIFAHVMRDGIPPRADQDTIVNDALHMANRMLDIAETQEGNVRELKR